MCRVDDSDPWKFFNAEIRHARRPYKCCECGRHIAIREAYRYAIGRMDDQVYTYRTCQHCEAAGHWLLIVCGGFLFEGLLEELVEHWEESPTLRSITLARLIAGMRHQWYDGRSPLPDRAAIAAAVPKGAHASLYA